ncbi:MAG: threonine synthase [candidate division KSB1 bacterium]|nr:threonine synthase [candidate division KSB1 bacterium]MDZ7272584.1 threonine synthase [candidate division KSB1 bacterium]MDZ7284393.1 threonine synthase [candidate division KSB1 bacterium]MDZ7297211.1 threonine synthase [candidate division KSB1 bacterium]MDZ7309313.1 threonine synthase [candidate division KSB1 bacterium]
MNELHACYRCSSGCAGEYRLDEIIYRCPHCHDLLEVKHDLAALRRRSGAQWRELFEQRYQLRAGASGIWAKKEWVHPLLQDDHIVSLGEGYSALRPAGGFGRHLGLEQLWIKQCGDSPTGSFKDLGMTVLVSQVKQMIAAGRPLQAVVCASTGDTSASLAAYCAAAGIPAVVLLPQGRISPAQLIQPQAHGSLTLALDTDFDGCMRLVQQLAARPEVYLANSMNSLRLEGQKIVAVELVQQLGWQVPDWVIVPGGNLGNVAALGNGFLLLRELGVIDRLPRLVCAQAAHANPLYESFRRGFRDFHPKPALPTLASAIQIGNPVSYKKAIRILQQCDGIVEQAEEAELAEAAALADRHGHFVCPQTGVALAALIKMAARRQVQPRERVVVIATANGLKFVEAKIAYHQQALAPLECRHANPVRPVAADLSAVLAAIAAHARARVAS